MNKVQILGTITRDVELKYAASGTAIGSFGIAYNEKRKQADGSYADKAHFFECTAFSKTAENINSYFRKGSRILIDGSLDFQSWVAQDGSKRSKVVIIVQRFDFIDRKSDNPAQQQQHQYGQQPAQQQYQQAAQQTQQQATAQPPVQQQQTQPTQQTIPVIQVEDEEIPFGYIGLSEGGQFIHCI